MATNKYFTNYNSAYEQRLIEDLVVETIKIHGLDMYYLPRELNTQPNVFGDDPISSFRQHFIVEMFLETVDGFEGDGDFIGKFGLEIRDSATFVVSKKRFGETTTSLTRPKEGDLLYFPLAKKFFEIKFVEHENPFYQLGKNYVYSLSVELFQYSEESINTQLDDIDNAVDEREFTQSFTVETPIGSGTFEENTTVFTFANGSTSGSLASSDSRATVVDFANSILTVKDTIGLWKTTDSDTNRYVMNENGLYAKMTSSTDKTDDSDFNDNKTIEDQINDFLDFSEINPFGEL